MEQSSVFNYFAQLYFLNLKESENKCLEDFIKVKNNNLYKDFMIKINKIKNVFKVGVGDTIRQRKRVYSLIKKYVSTYIQIYGHIDNNVKYFFAMSKHKTFLSDKQLIN